MSIPTLILSGYLGSGKTELIMEFLRDPKGLRPVVLAADLARGNLNAELIGQTGVDVIALDGENLAEAAARAVAMGADVLLVEASAEARPAALAGALSQVDGLAPPRIVTAVHLDAIGATLADPRVGVLARQQIEAADALALNRGDPGALPLAEGVPRVDSLHACLALEPGDPAQEAASDVTPAFDQAVLRPEPSPVDGFIGWLQKLRPAPHRAKGPLRLFDDEGNLATVWVNLAQGDLTLTPRPDLPDAAPHLVVIAPKG